MSGADRAKLADSIDATRKSLPVYALREELLEAIADSQVLIVVRLPPLSPLSFLI